jgi:hypothetical protein
MVYRIGVLFDSVGSSPFKESNNGFVMLKQNIFKKENGNSTEFVCFHPANTSVRTSILKESQKKMLTEVPNKINELKEKNSETEIRIIIAGHCMTAVAARDFAEELRSKISGERITIELIANDPSLGIKSGWSEKRNDLKKNAAEEKNFNSTIFYTAGGGLFSKDSSLKKFNRIANLNPVAINNANKIVICLFHHNDYHLWYHMFVGSEAGKSYEKLLKRPGVYFFVLKENTIVPYQITKNNLSSAVKEIYNFTKGREKERIKILTNIIAVKLKIPPDELCQILIKNHEKSKFDVIIESILKTFTVRGAFEIAFSLFEPSGLFFGYLNAQGNFYRSLKEAAKCVVGITHNNHAEAIEILERESKETKYDYKKIIISALISRIKRWYS